MTIEKLSSLVSRLMFVMSWVLLAGVILERLINVFGYTILRYQGGRMMEFAAIFLIFVIAIQLRQIRDELRRARATSGNQGKPT